MQRVRTTTAASVLPAIKHAGTPGYFTEGVPGTTPATVPGQDWFNAIQEELIHLITYAGLTSDGTDLQQVRKAIEALVALNTPRNVFKAITSHSASEITRNTTDAGGLADRTYTLAGFAGAAGLDAAKMTHLVVDVIIHSQTNGDSAQHAYLKASTTSVSAYAAIGGFAHGDNRTVAVKARVYIPIFLGDEEVYLGIVNTLAQSTNRYFEYTIAGVIQR